MSFLCFSLFCLLYCIYQWLCTKIQVAKGNTAQIGWGKWRCFGLRCKAFQKWTVWIIRDSQKVSSGSIIKQVLVQLELFWRFSWIEERKASLLKILVGPGHSWDFHGMSFQPSYFHRTKMQTTPGWVSANFPDFLTWGDASSSLFSYQTIYMILAPRPTWSQMDVKHQVLYFYQSCTYLWLLSKIDWPPRVFSVLGILSVSLIALCLVISQKILNMLWEKF